MNVTAKSARLTRGERIASLAIIFVVLSMAISQWLQIRSLQNGLSPSADAWTEADTLRAAAGYAVLGFGANAGLPDLCFGEQFAGEGTKGMLSTDLDAHINWKTGALAGRQDSIDGDRFIYTHYPPGPHWLAGLMTVTFGQGKVGLYRILPVAIGILCIGYLVWEMYRLLGASLAAVGLVVFASVPMFGNMMHGLSYQGYSLALLLLELAVCLALVRRDWRSPRLIGAMCMIGFFQGWLGFDYFFLIALAPLTVWMAVSSPNSSWKQMALSCLACAAAFGAAHLLHLAQVLVYYESATAALEDLVTIAHYRASGQTLDDGHAMRSARMILWDYLTAHTALPLHFNAPVLFFAACGVFALVLVRPLRADRSSVLSFTAIPTALVVSSCWVMLMSQHSAQHWHFIPRHYFLTIFIAALTILSALRGVHRVTRDRFPMLWLAVPPIAILLSVVLHSSVAGFALAVLRPLATFESLTAYGITATVFVWAARRPPFTWKRMLLCAPVFYSVVIALVMYARESIWPRGITHDDFASLRWVDIAPFAIFSGYLFVAAGWVIFRCLNLGGYFGAHSLDGVISDGLALGKRSR